MKSESVARRRNHASAAAAVALLGLAGCVTAIEIPIEIPLQAKLDVSSFRRVLVAGFLSESVEFDVDVGAETARLLQNQLGSKTAQGGLLVLEPDRPPLLEALAAATALQAATGSGSAREERERRRAAGDRLLQDAALWRRIGEEYQGPLIVTGRLSFEARDRAGFASDSQNAPDSPRPVRGRGRRRATTEDVPRYSERQGYALSAEVRFVDSRTGLTLREEKFSEEILYGEDQRVSPLSAYFELMDRLMPNFLGVIAPQRIRGTRVLLH
jgi:hypothetical protein